MKKAVHEDRIKFGALVVLVLQTTMLAMVARYTRTQPGPMYLVSTVVVISEAVKFAASLGLVMVEQGGVGAGLRHASREVCSRPAETLKMLVPALLFTMQNNLGYFALTHLDVATYQVLYQLKILTTALFSVMLLRRRLRWVQWGSLLLLVAGVALVQLSTLQSHGTSTRANSVLGLLAVLASCVSSGLAGVWFEKVLKASNVSVWVRNAQLAAFSIFVGLLNVYAMDGEAVSDQGFLYGFNSIVWTAVCLQAGGGLIVAVVIKRADNVVKGFATSASIVLSTFLSLHATHDLMPVGPSFFLGAGFVCAATLLYGIEGEVLWRWLCCEVMHKWGPEEGMGMGMGGGEEEEGLMLSHAAHEEGEQAA